MIEAHRQEQWTGEWWNKWAKGRSRTVESSCLLLPILNSHVCFVLVLVSHKRKSEPLVFSTYSVAPVETIEYVAYKDWTRA
jgi:hypothetical protein